MTCVLVLSLKDDLHAHIVRHELQAKGIDCHYLAVDALAGCSSISWHDDGRVKLWTDGRSVDLAEVDVIWWRRSSTIQKSAPELDEIQLDVINRDWRAALRGALIAQFEGSWVSHPDYTDKASLKAYQLRLASAVGLRVPKTLISNRDEDVRRFIDDMNGSIVKNVSGTLKTALFASSIDETTCLSNSSIQSCPTIYQEIIRGSKHLRICIFGDDIFAAEIRTENLDWRKVLPTDISIVPVSDDLAEKLFEYQRRAGLRMGIVDMKIDNDGEPVWLENNPQGQFLFVEGITSFPLAKRFAEFLFNEATRTNGKSATGPQVVRSAV
jgi:hypothetical protein